MTGAGNYTVFITDSKGCSVTSGGKNVSVNPVPTANAGPGRSPDRADALVWALTELMLGRRGMPRVLAI